MATRNKVDSDIENLFELLSVAKPIRVLVRTDKFLGQIELPGSKSDSGNMKRRRIGPTFLENSTVCTRGFSRRFAVFRRSRREKPLASRVVLNRWTASINLDTTDALLGNAYNEVPIFHEHEIYVIDLFIIIMQHYG